VSARRIALSGSAGTGKSTLARILAERLDLPYIEEGFRERVNRGLKLYELDERQRRELMKDMWEEQRERELAAADGFVSDRSSVDFAAFWLHYDLMDAVDDTREFLDYMGAELERVERVLLCPWGVLPLEPDGVRSTNPWLQLRYQSLLEGMHLRYTPAEKLVRVPESDDLERRLEAVSATL